LFVKLTKHLLADNGQWFAMKGVAPQAELVGLDIKLVKLIKLQVAGTDAERHLVILEKSVLES
jgi:16S rRNA (guanine527-N7)-methyltransferase